jgi:hypothetical protein
MSRFLVTISARGEQITRNIIASSSVQAIITALQTIPSDFQARKIAAKVVV